ncbi:hypothetical protein SOASR014_23190 [Pectobacterium carotovorum subsp. carotovorum]|nr:hypothetical protein SOASR014_23190 [Pectobacterium carotovorum subsp. carotovorum]GLX45142.1 hypothetical protein Pcaca01_28100 [Pectobacterium carotovorum subsp. carotovorum]
MENHLTIRVDYSGTSSFTDVVNIGLITTSAANNLAWIVCACLIDNWIYSSSKFRGYKCHVYNLDVTYRSLMKAIRLMQLIEGENPLIWMPKPYI